MFFFFKQKTAYEIRLSLVGSEMCIRDRMFYELCGESSDLFQTYDRMRNLSPTQLHFIESLVQFEFDFARNLETVPSVSREDYTTMIIPSGNMHDGMVYDSCSLEKINISGYRKRYGNPVSYTHLRAHETKANLVCRLLLEKKKAPSTMHRPGQTRMNQCAL